ncbi:guanylate cyclase [Moorena producens PAL-8-15-08-1]|uniref:Guanylate cyclase n=1 Tax=Moorena producens PAL-8-15-08-1 TaxID=1458985 RepID=A0A1D8TZD1_9CYAN|nr:adenylate/guanylate cyclase domain-containing protein [Moorena producens]AOX02997.1 guanylate cyclase [Moorena producens PAL-8-15-08-1]
MASVSLKKIISKPKALGVISQLIDAIDTVVQIEDIYGKLLLDNPRKISVLGDCNLANKYPVEARGQVIGWVKGDQKAIPIKELLNYLANQELEKKDLGSAILDQYREINLLYRVSERIPSCLELSAIAQLFLDEARRLIPGDCGSVLLINSETDQLDIISAFGKQYNPKDFFQLSNSNTENGLGIGKAEIVNQVQDDPRFIATVKSINSLVCAPLKTQKGLLGVINFCSEKPVNYTAQDLKFLTILGAQAAGAIENALLHRNKLQEERIKSRLERYIPSQLVQAIIDAKGNISLTPAKKPITILFSDIRNFTTRCEELEAHKIVEYLNEYFTSMVDVIFSHDGTVNKFVGDMIVAMFGAPSKLEDNQGQAIAAAIAMQHQLKTMPTPWIRENFLTGIGISSGEVVVGNIGSPQHMDYTAIGDEVNIAARLQAMANGGQILVSGSVYEATKHQYTYRELGQVSIKGKRQTVDVFELIN